MHLYKFYNTTQTQLQNIEYIHSINFNVLKILKAIVYSIGGFEWISISRPKSAEFSLQTSKNNLKPP